MDTLRLYLGRVASLGVVAMAMHALSCSSLQTTSNVPAFPDPNALQHRHARVAVVGDLQRTGAIETWRENNDRHRPQIISGILADKPDALVLLGDMVWWGAGEGDWAYFDRLMKPVHDSKIGVLPTLGNHDYYGNDNAAMANIMARWPWFRQDGIVRVVDSVAWIILNTNADDIGIERMKAHLRWFARSLANADADSSILAIIVCGHHPPYTNSTVVGPAMLIQRNFVPLFVASRKGALWLGGHAHAYERFDVSGRVFVVSGGGGGPRQKLQTGNAARYRDQYAGSAIRPLHHLLVERHGSTLAVTMRPLHIGSEPVHASDSVLIVVGGTDHTAGMQE